jgi:hypothetical protein
VTFETNWAFRKPVVVVASIARFRMSWAMTKLNRETTMKKKARKLI